MKTILKHLLPAAMVLLHISCVKEQEQPVSVQEKDMIFYGYTDAATKTSLNDDFSVSWQNGDAISIFSGTENSRFEAEGISEDGKTATFRGPVSNAETYYAVYPYSETATIDGTSIYAEFPAMQNAVAGTFDPLAALTTAKTSGNTLHFMNTGAIVGFSVKGTGISSVTLTSADGMTPMAGEAAISFDGDTPVMTVDKTGSHGITMNGPFAEGERYYLVVAPGTYNGLALRFTDTQGRICTKSMVNKVSIERCGNKWLGEFDIPDTAWKEEGSISADWIANSSSTLTFSWGEGVTAAENYSHPYWFGLYRDEGLTDLVVRYNSEKASPIWNKTKPAFTFGGLEKNTEYWFAVTDPVTMCTSRAVEARTSDFTVVQPSEAECAEGSVILAEDFSEIAWNADELNAAAGFRSADISVFTTPSGEFPEGEFGERSTFESLLFYTDEKSLGEAVSKSRLAQWGAIGQEKAAADRKKVIFARPGYLKLGGYSYVSGIVTPAMSCIPEGKSAKVRVTFTASRYNDKDSRQLLVSTAEGEMKDYLFTVSSRHDSRIALDETKGWNEYTVELGNVTSASHIIISPDFEAEGTGNGSNQHRVFIDDITVEVVRLKDAGEYDTAINAEAVAQTSSTVTVRWNEGEENDKYSYPYNFGLYKDASLTESVAHYTSGAGDAAWGNKTPIFTFAGLDTGTTYYFAVFNDINMTKSEIIELRTDDFTVIEPSEVSCTEGAVILAENFSELVYGGDGVNVAAGVDKYGVLCNQGNESLLWEGEAMKGKRLDNWSALGQEGDTKNAVLARPGYLKLGGYSYCVNLVSPALECIPQGKEAKVKITFTASRYGSDSQDAVVSLVKGTAEDNRFTVESRSDVSFRLDAGTGWAEYSFELDGARSDSRILIGPDFGKSGKGNGSNQHRMYLGDVKVEILLISKADGINAEFAGATSSTLKFKWTKTRSEASFNEAYEFGLYRDQELADPVKVFRSEAGAAAWSKTDPAFIFSGLEKGRTYYFHVSNPDDPQCESDVISATTEEFKNVSPDNVQAAVGAVILAEDFSEYMYGGDGVEPYKAAGIDGPAGKLCDYGKDSGFSIQPLLAGWSVFGGNVYSRPGYMKLGTGSGSAALVTPELSCIPAGKEARIRVSFSAAIYDKDNRNSIVSLVTGTTSANNKFTVNLRTENEQFELNNKAGWAEYSFEFDGARSDSRILIGPDHNNESQSNRRMFLDNIRIEIVGLSDAGIYADFVKATSSTLKFKWTKCGSEASYNEAYTFGLYRDQELTDPVNVYSSAAGAAAWSKRDPVFIFSGLEKGRTYYFHVKDKNDSDCKSRVIAATVEEFTNVSPDNAQAVPGAVILAEDFSEFLYGGDGVGPNVAVGVNKSGALVNSGNDTGIDMNGCLNKWSLLCQRVTSNDNYTRPGYIKLGGGNYVSDLVTPELSCIPEGKKAKIRVTFSAAPYTASEVQSIISLVKVNSASHQFTKDEIETTIQSYQFDLPSNVEWNTSTYEFDGAANDSRVLIGPDADRSGKGNGNEKSQHRMFLDNIVIEIISIQE